MTSPLFSGQASSITKILATSGPIRGDMVEPGYAEDFVDADIGIALDDLAYALDPADAHARLFDRGVVVLVGRFQPAVDRHGPLVVAFALAHVAIVAADAGVVLN